MNLYSYNGPVMELDKLIMDDWKGVTQAVSESKARNNLAYQFKKTNNRLPSAKIYLPGEIEKMK